METEFSKKMDELVQDLDTAIQEMDLSEDAYTVGVNNIQGLIDGTESQRQALINKYAELGRAALAAYKQAVDQHSPSKEFEKSGRFDIQGLIGGAEEEKANLAATYEDLAQTALESMAMHLPTTKDAPAASEVLGRQMEELSAAAINAISGLTQGSSTASPIVFTIMLPDSTKLATYLIDPLIDVADANGTPIANPIS